VLSTGANGSFTSGALSQSKIDSLDAMARGRKTGGRKKGTCNRATEEARVAAQATGILPLDYMLAVMRDPAADHRRRDAMAMAAAPYLHPKLSTIDAKLTPATSETSAERPTILVEFVVPTAAHSPDQE
jgi:hypothetical protein